MNRLFSLMLLAAGFSAVAMAVPVVPEVDPASCGTALALISTGLLILRGRRKS